MFKDILWFLAFCAVLAASIAARSFVDVPAVWWLASAVEGVCLVGMFEALHQACHNNLIGRTWLNPVLGCMIGAVLGTSYAAYRRFHQQHHVYSNHDADAEKLYYQTRTGRAATLLGIPLIIAGYSAVVNRGSYLQDKDQGVHGLCIALIWAVRVSMVAFLMIDPVGFAFTVAIPYVVFSWLEFFMSQSQHYGRPLLSQPPTGMEHYAVSTNVALPSLVAFLCLNSNLHATHHVNADCKWYDSYAELDRHGRNEELLPFGTFLARWWKGGRKVWSDLPVAA